MTAIYKLLKNASSSSDMTVDGSTVAVDFYFEAAEQGTEIERMIVSYSDAGTFDAALYGNGLILTTGIDALVENSTGTELLDLLDGEPIKSNLGWQAQCHDWAYNDVGTGDNTATARWTFSRAGQPLRLNKGDRLVVRVNDDLTGLTTHQCRVQGRVVK